MVEAVVGSSGAAARTGGAPVRKPDDADPRAKLAEGRYAVEAALAAVLGYPEGGAQCRSTRCKQIAMYLLHVGRGVSMERVGEAFGRDRSTVGHACRVIEDGRDEPRLDRLLDCLEAASVALAEALEVKRMLGGRL